MRKLLVYLKDYKKETVLAPLFKMLEASFELLIPLVMASIIDVGIAGRDTGYIWKMCLIMITLGVIGLVCSVTAQFFAAKAAVGFATKLRHALFSHIQRLSFTEMDTVGTSAMITRMTSDVNQTQSGVNMVLRLFLRSPFIVIGAAVMAFTVDGKAAVIFVVIIPLLAVVVCGIMLICIPFYRKVQAGLDRILQTTRENLTGIRVIRAFHKEQDEKEQFARENRELTRLQMFVGRILAMMNPVTYIMINGAIIVLIYVGAVRVDIGMLTQGAVVALLNYMSQILVELIKLANLIITVTKALACADRIEQVLELESSQQENENGSAEETTEEQYAVSFEHAGLIYSGAGEEALTDIQLSVKKGETIGIIGGTGSGKTSMVHLIPRFYDATGGRVRVNGKDVRDYTLKELRLKIGIVMQSAVLFHGTVRENLLWGSEAATEAELQEALRIAQAEEFVMQKEGGLDYRIMQGGKNLSGGQKQRLTIARALVRKPEILILDDSASALDYATDAKLRQAIGEMQQKPTVFIVSQRAASIRHADRIVVLDDGRIAAVGTHESLLEECEIYKEIYYSQFPKEDTVS